MKTKNKIILFFSLLAITPFLRGCGDALSFGYPAVITGTNSDFNIFGLLINILVAGVLIWSFLKLKKWYTAPWFKWGIIVALIYIGCYLITTFAFIVDIDTLQETIALPGYYATLVFLYVLETVTFGFFALFAQSTLFGYHDGLDMALRFAFTMAVVSYFLLGVVLSKVYYLCRRMVFPKEKVKSKRISTRSPKKRKKNRRENK